MNARCNNKSVLLFEKLPHLPLHLVHKALNFSSLALNALLSEKLEALIKSDGMRMESKWDIEMTHDEIWIQLKFENKEKENFGLCFKEDLDLEMEMTQDVRVHQENNLVTFFHKANEHLEDTCFKALQLLIFLFPPTSYRNITVSLGPRSPEFPFRFLLQLPRGTAFSIGLHADQKVEGVDLVNFLRNVRVDKYLFGMEFMLDVSARIKNLVKCDELVFDNIYAKIADARFLTSNFMKQFGFFFSEFGQNDFTSRDFNAFLRSWMNFRRGFHPNDAKFEIRKDQKIKMKEVMKGLNPHVGLPRIRDRWRFSYPKNRDFGRLYLTAIDMADGWDIENNRGEVGTVLLEPNRLTFYFWVHSCPWLSHVHSLEHTIALFTREIERLNRERSIIQKKVDAGTMELFPPQVAYLEEYPEKMRIEQERLALACEVKEKLMTVWKNDDSVYKPLPPTPLNDGHQDYRVYTILIVGSADVALDSIPLIMQFYINPFNFRETVYNKKHDKMTIRMRKITDVTLVHKDLLRSVDSIIYAYSDSDSFDHLSMQFISLRKIFGKVVSYPIRQACSMLYPNALNLPIRQVNSILLHLPGSNGKDKDQPDQVDVESFQRKTWSDLYEFDPNSNSPIHSDI